MSLNHPGRSSAIDVCATSYWRSSANRRIAATLRRIDLIGIAPEFADEAEYYTLQNASSWQRDPPSPSPGAICIASPYRFDWRIAHTFWHVHRSIGTISAKSEA
ncbi:hypothetical protein [Bradyrhizobium sp. 45]|jgi:hypothetical protein|uniref:hypothetical protein n=1 Tax=Bradyrhizobium sp. 45 TaxID=1043587 RepID=UPI001FFB16C8|nr:hypothetical protein [Bradyrhizobium sp. 45]MCK1307773.1 hypothetical protein [Bradyrhizobium sp. 45]